MMRPSKYLVAFTSLSLFLGMGLLVASSKFLPIFLQHTVYYCQTALKSFSMQIPGGIGAVLTGVLILLIGFAVSKLLVSYVRVTTFRKTLNGSIRPSKVFGQLVIKLELQNKVFLLRNDKPFAFCHGIRHPKIYISSGLLSIMNTGELEAILRHEQYHLKHKDSFIMLLAEIAKSLFPFFPLMSDLIHNYRIDREIAADHQASLDIGNSQSLVSVLKKLLLCEPIEQYALAPALADHETLEIRIKALVNKKYHFMKFKMIHIFISLLSLGTFMVLLVAPVQAVEMHDQGHDVMMVCLQNDDCSVWCKENKTVIPYSKAPNASRNLMFSSME